MVAAVRVHKPGGPEVLKYEDIEVGAPGEGQFQVRVHVCGLNYVDTYLRSGLYPPSSLPFVLGNEGAGEIIAVGPGVKDFKVGDRVAWVAPGSYAAERLLPADRAIKLPDKITYEQAAGMMLKGMTVRYLLRRTYKVQKGDNVLIHAAAGGIGLIACQRPVRGRHQRRGKDPDQPEIRAEGRSESPSGSGEPKNHWIIDPDSVTDRGGSARCIREPRSSRAGGTASQPAVQESPGALDGAARFRQHGREQMPYVRHARPDLELDMASGRTQLLGHAHRIVA